MSGTTGPSSSLSPTLVPVEPNISFASIISAGDAVAGSVRAGTTAPWRFVGVPDGIGAFDNGDGTATILVNHEIGATAGVTRAHGSVGSFVSALTVNKTTLAVTAARDLATTTFVWDATANAGTGGYLQQTTALARLCSGDLPDVQAYFDAATGLGTTDRIYMAGEETGAEGRGFAFIATGSEAGRAYELPRLGNFSFENMLASPDSGARTVVIGTDDSTPGQVYVYVGDKQATGTAVDRAGLTNGQLFGINAGFTLETNGTTPLAGNFTLSALGNVQQSTGGQLETASDALGVTEWLRPEDGAWDTLNPNRFYFVTTNNATSPSRLWALDFTDVRNPTLGGRFTALLDGTEGQVMLDNLTVAADGTVFMVEDPGNNPRNAKIWAYLPGSDRLVEVGEHDVARNGNPTTPATLPFTQDEEASGIIDVTTIFGDANRLAFLVDDQQHYAFGAAGSADRTEIVEGGQLLLMYVARPQNGGAGSDRIRGSYGDDTLNALGGNDRMWGGAGNDVLFGDGGNDIIEGGRGSDVINGGAGSDWAVLSGNRADWTITLNADGSRSAVRTGERETLVNIERIRFDDSVVTLTNDAVGNVVHRMYDTVFNRPADAPGLANWINQIDNVGMSIQTVARLFLATPEAAPLAALNNTQFVNALFTNALGRAADTAGSNFWTGLLNSGAAREVVVFGISESAEHQQVAAAPAGGFVYTLAAFSDLG